MLCHGSVAFTGAVVGFLGASAATSNMQARIRTSLDMIRDSIRKAPDRRALASFCTQLPRPPNGYRAALGAAIGGGPQVKSALDAQAVHFTITATPGRKVQQRDEHLNESREAATHTAHQPANSKSNQAEFDQSLQIIPWRLKEQGNEKWPKRKTKRQRAPAVIAAAESSNETH